MSTRSNILELLPPPPGNLKVKNKIILTQPTITKKKRLPLKEITQNVYKDIDSQFISIMGVEFVTAQAQIKTISLTKTPTKIGKKATV